MTQNQQLPQFLRQANRDAVVIPVEAYALLTANHPTKLVTALMPIPTIAAPRIHQRLIPAVVEVESENNAPTHHNESKEFASGSATSIALLA
jgi:hypothetical protein